MPTFATIAGHNPPWLWAILLSVLAALGGALWAGAQYRRAQRHANRILHALSESITAATSPAEIAGQLAELLPAVSQATSARLFLHSHSTKSLDYVPTPEDPVPMAVPVDNPPEGLAIGLVKCFTSRAIVPIPDVRRNPLVSAGWQPGVARSVMFVPLLAQQDRIGVLEVASLKRIGYYSREDQAAFQHLSNQVASSLKLQGQRAIREQLFRSEKLAASAQLISGVASELSEPLDNIQQMADALAARSEAAAASDLRPIAAEARRASDILSRLISFAHPDTVSARAVDVSAIIAGLVHFRGGEWKTRGLRIQDRLTAEPAWVLGSRGQLEQLFLNLMVHAEQCAANASDRALKLSSSCLGGKVVVEILYSCNAPRESLAEAGDALGLDVCRGIAAAHNGEIRIVSQSSSAGFEIEIPLMSNAAPGAGVRQRDSRESGGAKNDTKNPPAGADSLQDMKPVNHGVNNGVNDQANAPAPVPRKAARPMTLLVVDPDAAAQRQLLGMLAARGHRVIPAPSEQAADLAPRMRFDAIFWAVRSGGPKWSDQQERIRPAVPAFVLVSDGYDHDLATSLEDSGGYLLARPLQAADLDRVLDAVETRTATRTPA